MFDLQHADTAPGCRALIEDRLCSLIAACSSRSTAGRPDTDIAGGVAFGQLERARSRQAAARCR